MFRTRFFRPSRIVQIPSTVVSSQPPTDAQQAKQELQTILFEIEDGLVRQPLPTTVCPDDKPFFAWHNTFESIGLSECACKDGQFDRDKFDRRKKIEKGIITRVKSNFPCVTDQTVTLDCLSIGPGYLLQDFTLYAQLLIAGYSLNIRLIGITNDKEIQSAYKQFVKLLGHYAQRMNKDFSVASFSNMMDYLLKYPNEKLHVAHAIDFSMPIPKALPDLLLAHQALAPKGIFLLALDEANYFYTQTHCTYQANDGRTEFDPKTQSALELVDYQRKTSIPKLSAQNKSAVIGFPFLKGVFNSAIVKNILIYAGYFAHDFKHEPIVSEPQRGFTL